MSTEYTRARKTQQDRAHDTRERILKAAVECLVERGYAGTTTTEVAKRAGVSRGAQMYHFATKRHLVITTVEYLFERRNEEFRAAVLKLPETRARSEAAVDLLWEMRSSDSFLAWLEVQVASRTDPDLLESLRALNKRMSAAIHTNFEEMFPELAAVPLFAVIPDFVLGLLGGLALDQIAGCEEARVERVIDTLKMIGGLLDQLPDLGGLERLLPGLGA